MYRVEYLFEGRWKEAIEVPSLMIAASELRRLGRAYLVRMSGGHLVGYAYSEADLALIPDDSGPK